MKPSEESDGIRNDPANALTYFAMALEMVGQKHGPFAMASEMVWQKHGPFAMASEMIRQNARASEMASKWYFNGIKMVF